MKNGEHILQKSCVTWFRLQYPVYKSLLFAIPNGGDRNRVVAAKLKAEGVLAGVPDLFLAVPVNHKGTPGEYHLIGLEEAVDHTTPGLFIEMKTPGQYPRKHQKEVIEQLRNQGYQVEICRSLDEFIDIVNRYLK